MLAADRVDRYTARHRGITRQEHTRREAGSQSRASLLHGEVGQPPKVNQYTHGRQTSGMGVRAFSI